LRVERIPKLGIIIHIRIDGVYLGNCGGDYSSTSIQHAPFTRAALEASVTKKVALASTLPEYSNGYDNWLSHCGGVYTINVNEMVGNDDMQFRQSKGCQ
jgi:hypothetical protein